jgi:proline-specific peptidase
MVSHPVDQAPFEHPPGQHHEVRGHRLWVETEGSGPDLLLLSGLGPAGSHLVFHPQFSDLADSFRVIYVDLYGRGKSDVPADLRDITFDGDVQDLTALIPALQIDPVHIYGFSYGGMLAQALALEQPHLVRSLILANTLHSPEMWQQNHANINLEISRQYPEIWERVEALRAVAVASTDPRMQELLAVATRLVRFYNPNNSTKLLSEPGSRNHELYPIFCGADVDFIIGGQIPRIPDFRPRLKDIRVPILVVAGRYDRALYPSYQRQFTHFAPTAELLMLERSGSFGHVEEPDELFTAVRSFLARA